MSIFAFAETSIQLVPDGTMLLHILIIVVMVVVLNRTLLKPINGVLAARERRTEEDLSGARSILARVSQTASDYEHKLREARTAGYQLLERERAEAVEKREQQVLALKQEINGWVQTRTGDLHREAEAARNEMRDRSKQLASEIAERVLDRPVSSSQR
jgi:F0F1-type ATP synthase membrane subunit b/b'